MFRINAMSRTPVYEQIIAQTEKLISAGLLNAGDKMPSVRNLSLELSVNPNTIQKSYNELDARGIITSVPGKGCFISENAKEAILKNSLSKLAELKSLAAELYGAGVSEEDVIAAVKSGISERKGEVQ